MAILTVISLYDRYPGDIKRPVLPPSVVDERSRNPLYYYYYYYDHRSCRYPIFTVVIQVPDTYVYAGTRYLFSVMIQVSK